LSVKLHQELTGPIIVWDLKQLQHVFFLYTGWRSLTLSSVRQAALVPDARTQCYFRSRAHYITIVQFIAWGADSQGTLFGTAVVDLSVGLPAAPLCDFQLEDAMATKSM